MTNRKQKGQKLKAIRNMLQTENESNFTMTEIIPTIKEFLGEKYGCFYMIQSRYILLPNQFQSILEEPTYHLSIKYYAHPSSIYFLVPNNIMVGGTPYNLEWKENEIAFIPMDREEQYRKEQKEIEFRKLKMQEKMIWLATEERDLTIEEIMDKQNWISPNISLEKRKINSELLSSVILQYLNQRKNGTLQPMQQLSEEAIEKLIDELFELQKEKTK